MINRRSTLKTLGASVGVGALAGCTVQEVLTNETVNFAAQPASPLGVQMDEGAQLAEMENPSWGPPSASEVIAAQTMRLVGMERNLEVQSWAWTSVIYAGGDFRTPSGELIAIATPEVKPSPGMSDQNPLADISPGDVVGDLGSTTGKGSDAGAVLEEHDVVVDENREFSVEFVQAGYTGSIDRLTGIELEQAGDGVRGTATAVWVSPAGSETDVDLEIAASKLMDAGDHLFIIGFYPTQRAGEIAGLDDAMAELYDQDSIRVTDDENADLQESAALLYHPETDDCGTGGGCKPMVANLLFKSRVQHIRRIPPHIETLVRETQELLTQAVDTYDPPDQGNATLSIVREMQDTIEEVKALAGDIEGDRGERLLQRAESRSGSTQDAIGAGENGDWESARRVLEEVWRIVTEDIAMLEGDCESAVCKNALEVEERLLGQTAVALDTLDGADEGTCRGCSVLSDTREDVQTIEELNMEVGELLGDLQQKKAQGDIEETREIASTVSERGKTIDGIAGRARERIAGIRVQSRESGGAFLENIQTLHDNFGEIEQLAKKDYNSSISNTSASVA